MCCGWVEVDITLRKAGIIGIISSSYFDSLLIHEEILSSYGGLAYYPARMYCFTKVTLLINRSGFFFLLNLAISLECQ